MSKLHAVLLSFTLFVFMISAAVIGILAYRLWGQRPTEQATISRPVPAIISGSILYSAAEPLPTNEALGRIVLYQRRLGEVEFEQIPINVPLVTAATWAWSGAESGQTYELVAAVEVQGTEVSRSHSIVVTAPAGGEQLVFNSAETYLPEHLSMIGDSSDVQPTPQLSAPQYVVPMTPVPSPLPSPVPSPRPSVTPSQQPSASPSLERAAVIGSIDLNGPVANNSSILILQRKPGETGYRAVARIPAADGQSWSFDSATVNTQYEMTAALQVNETNTSTANAVTVTAPTSGVLFRINTNVSLDAPGKPRLVTCGTRKSDGKWPAELVFDQQANANSYWFQVGTTAGASNTFNQKRGRSKTNEEKITLDFNHGQDYFIRYAQAQCSDCRSDQDYSGFSETLQVKCG